MEYILTSRQFDFAVTCPRVTGGLSVLGSSLTLVTLARTRTSRGGPGRVYRRLVAALSLYDIVYSGLWAANRVMMPTDYGLLYTHGNTASCTAQGFLLQWSTGTFAYSMWISLYYVAVVRYRVTERTLATCFEPLAHGLTLVYCLGWAITVWAMDMIGVNGGLVCSFTTKPFPCGDTSLGLPACTSGQWYDGVKWMALLGPAALYSFVIFASLVMVGVTVVHQRRKVQRTLLGNSVGLSSSSSLPVPASSTSMATPEAVPASATHSARDVHNPAQKRDGQLRQVTTQCILYGVTFFNTIFWQCLYLVLMLTEKYQKDPARLYWLLAMSLFLSPLQGLFNHIIHTRPRYLQVRSDYPDKPFWWHYGQAVWNSPLPRRRAESDKDTPTPEQDPQRNKPPEPESFVDVVSSKKNNCEE